MGLVAGCSGESSEVAENKADMPMQILKYPETRRGAIVDTYFGEEVADPYRWLEDDRSEETGNWIRAQNEVTFGYLNKIPYRDTLRGSLENRWNYERVSAPVKEGDYTYFYKNDGLQDQSIVYREKREDEEEVFLDPNKLSNDGTISLADLSFSKDGSIAAYATSDGGSDWRRIVIINAETREELEDPIVDVKFSGISWRGNDGFYYSGYDKPEGSELSAKTDQHKLYYHKLGQTQNQDQLVYGGRDEEKHRYISGYVSEDDRYLVISGGNSTTGNDLYLRDLTKPAELLVTILDDFDSDTYVLDNVGTKLYLVTNRDAQNKKIVTVDAADPGPENWVDLVPETEHVLTVVKSGGMIFAEYMIDAISKVYQYDYNGKKLGELDLPGPGNFFSTGGKREDPILYYGFTNYKTPSTLYAFDIEKRMTTVYRNSGANFNPDDYESNQVFYESRDGTRIPMIITHKKDMKLDGKNPTILYGYGGFNVSLTPNFNIPMSVWMEKGGIYAIPNLRGGGEYGEAWHNAGIKQNKQNVFDDFIAAAEYLINNNYTSSDHLAIFGGSNGGLLVGAVLTQRPELVKVALPAVGVLDMLRYHTFTAGAGWAYDYGTAEESVEMFEYLRGYSPLHNIKQGGFYPATLITTADHDDRVVPAHSFKFAAELQSKQAKDEPVLIRVETRAGHGLGTPVSKSIEQYADILSFTLFNMGVEELD